MEFIRTVPAVRYGLARYRAQENSLTRRDCCQSRNRDLLEVDGRRTGVDAALVPTRPSPMTPDQTREQLATHPSEFSVNRVRILISFDDCYDIGVRDEVHRRFGRR